MNLACQKKVVYVIAGNKMDLLNEGDLTNARTFAESIRGGYIETSAKTGKNVQELLVLVARSISYINIIIYRTFGTVKNCK